MRVNETLFTQMLTGYDYEETILGTLDTYDFCISVEH